MREKEAEELGFIYTGMSEESCDKDKVNKIKERAKLIKKTFKGADYRIVSTSCYGRYGVCHYTSIYGNDLFYKFKNFNKEDEEAMLNIRYKEMLESETKRHEERLKEIEEFRKYHQDLYDEALSLMKKA